MFIASKLSCRGEESRRNNCIVFVLFFIENTTLYHKVTFLVCVSHSRMCTYHILIILSLHL